MDGQYRIGDIVFHNWVIKEKLGEGSFGKVYEIQREDFGQIYLAALKVVTIPQSETELRRQLEDGMSQHSAATFFYSIVEEIVREFALMARLKGTANIVSYEDHEVVRHQSGVGWDILIRMELLTPLLTYAQDNPFTRRDVIRLSIDMCRALELCQKYNIIHRDIKPQNIFVSANGDFKLGDFGIARTVEKTISNLTKIGTPDYMAPEVHWDLEYGFSVDIYSLGLVLYRLLNRNRLPFLPPAPEPITYSSLERASARRKNGEDIPPPFHAEGRLAEIVLKAMSYLPKDRYSSPRQMREDLESILYDKEDAEIIYPDGDEVSLQENIYTPHVLKNELHETLSISEPHMEGTVSILYTPAVVPGHSDSDLETEKGTPFKLNWEEYEEIKDISPHEEHTEKKKPLLIMLAAVAICLGFLIFFGVRVLFGILDTPVIENDNKPQESVVPSSLSESSSSQYETLDELKQMVADDVNYITPELMQDVREVGGWVYFRHEVEFSESAYANNQALFRYKKGDSAREYLFERLNEELCFNYNVVGNDVIFEIVPHVGGRYTTLYSIRPDGMVPILLADYVSEYQIIDNFIYYNLYYGAIVYPLEDCGLWRANIDGTENIIVAYSPCGSGIDYGFNDYWIDGEWLYGANYSWKIRLGEPATGDEEFQILLSNYEYEDEWIYYYTNKLIKAKRDGSEQIVLDNTRFEGQAECYVENGWIYYYEWAIADVIYKIRTDGTDKTEIPADEYYASLNNAL